VGGPVPGDRGRGRRGVYLCLVTTGGEGAEGGGRDLPTCSTTTRITDADSKLPSGSMPTAPHRPRKRKEG